MIVDKGGRNRDFSQLGGELRGTANVNRLWLKIHGIECSVSILRNAERKRNANELSSLCDIN